MPAPTTLDKLGGNVDWTDVIGMDWYDEFTVTDKITGDPINITGYTIAAAIATAPNGTGDTIAAFTTTIVDGPGGVFSVHIPRATTATVTPGEYYWACAVTDGDDIEVRWMFGTFIATDGVPL